MAILRAQQQSHQFQNLLQKLGNYGQIAKLARSSTTVGIIKVRLSLFEEHFAIELLKMDQR